MALTQLLTVDTWSTLTRLSTKRGESKAAIAYVTEQHLHFKEGDLLICDASDKAIRAGMTSAATLAKFVENHAKVYSIKGMHVKMGTFDRYAFIGSANMSPHAGTRTFEASLLTTDVQVRSSVLAHLDELLREPTLKHVDESFIMRILGLPVSKRTVFPERDVTTVAPKFRSRESRVWWVSTKPLSPRAERELESRKSEVVKRAAAAMRMAKDATLHQLADAWERDPDSLDPIVFRPSERILKNLQRGDVIVVCHTAPSGRATVSAPATYLTTEIVEGRAHLVYLQNTNPHTKSWSKVARRLAKLGSTLKRTSTRRLTNRERLILDFLDAE